MKIDRRSLYMTCHGRDCTFEEAENIEFLDARQDVTY